VSAPRPRRVALLAGLLAGALACTDAAPDGAGAPAPSAGPPDPAPREGRSLVLLVLDTLRADHMSLYGYERRRTTPFLEELGAEAWVFERAYVPASWTRASTASLLTSRLPESHGAEDRFGRVADEVTMLGEILQSHGYETKAVVANGNVIGKWGFAQGYDEFRFVKDFPRRPYADAEVMDPVVREVAATLGDEPFFLYLHYVDPHDPYYVHEGFDFTDPDYSGPIEASERKSLDAFNAKRPDDADVEHVLALYDGEIAWLDDYLRGLFAHLAETGVLEDAWVAITSDHGEGLWRHRTRAHGGEVYEEQLRVPLIVRPPGGLASGRRVEAPISLIDVAPTLFELMGLALHEDFEGRSWAPFLLGRGDAPVRPIIVDEQLDAFDMSAIIDGDRKLIFDLTRGRAELYDLEDDPHEQDGEVVRIGGPLPAPARVLQRVLQRALVEAKALRPAEGTGQGDGPEGDEPMDPELRAILEGMGYLGGEGAGEEQGAGDPPGDEPPRR